MLLGNRAVNAPIQGQDKHQEEVEVHIRQEGANQDERQIDRPPR